MFNPIDKVIGQHIIGDISEPWGVTTSNGDNIFYGQIISVELNTENEQILLCDVSPFEYQGKNIQRIAARRRNKSKFGICSDLLAGERVTIHFSFRTNGDPIEIGAVGQFFVENPKPYFMIGSLRLETL